MMISNPALSRPALFPNAQFERLPYDRPLWLSCSLAWPQVDLLSILEKVEGQERFYWSSQRALGGSPSISLLGWGKAAELTDWGTDRFHAIQEQARLMAARYYPLNPEAPLEAGPFWFGSFAFQPRPIEDQVWKAFPDASFLLPRWQLAAFNNQTWLTINFLVEQVEDRQAVQDCFQECLDQAWTLCQPGALSTGKPASQRPSVPEILPGLSPSVWQVMVDGALERIRRGRFQKVVLARTLQVRFSTSPSVRAILESLAKNYPDCYHFLVEPEPGQVFLGASPELLVEASAPLFRSTALAGSMARSHDPQADQALGQALLDSPKERAEHAIVVQAIQEKLAPLVESLVTAAQPGLRRLGNVQHLETPIHGRLAPGWGVLDVAAALHPTPALGGWPKEAAQAYLAEAEPFNRGWYAAPLGWFDPWGNGLFAVAIRSGLLQGNQATLFAGAGIVEGSDPLKEWQETRLKFRPMLEAIGARETD